MYDNRVAASRATPTAQQILHSNDSWETIRRRLRTYERRYLRPRTPKPPRTTPRVIPEGRVLENGHYRKFTLEQVKEIRAAYADGCTIRELSRTWNISWHSMRNILKGLTYKDGLLPV